MVLVAENVLQVHSTLRTIITIIFNNYNISITDFSLSFNIHHDE